ncbi:oocyte zinc finger protein XlCOF6 [Sitodiplosis mosellana]|uniref:oocyte zinc finger protein XlCOF6 n=1 Tax=Sitodiplosis mosellana TaxID=263140 RepID=UPI002444B3DB|nr:oocyte zinc finger protein XlCOF6 [Sitodiplosis mosellana]
MQNQNINIGLVNYSLVLSAFCCYLSQKCIKIQGISKSVRIKFSCEMPSFCAVANCELKYSHSENVSFHKFPLKNAKILAEWIKFTNRGSNWKPSRWNSICSRHFDKSDFREYLSRKCLKKEAIPTIITKNNISYETYHISTGSPDDTRTAHSEQDDYGATAEAFDDSKASSEEICRLCGDRADNLTCNALRSLDDPEVDLMCRKCLPAVNVYAHMDQSRIACSDCIAQLKQYADFIDKVLLYQRELGVMENFDSYATSENSLVNGNRRSGTIKPSTPNPNPNLFIKQEPINVKQEKVESSNRRPFTAQIPTTSPSLCPNPFAEPKKMKGVAQQEINLPKTELSSTYCEECDRIFANNFEFQSHECTSAVQNADREQGNNCEIMEVITLNNPISFIDLAEDENATNIEPRKPKAEGLIEFEQRERLEFEHAYAKRAASASCNLKQEIIDSYNDASQNGYDYNDQATENEDNQGTCFEESAQTYFDCPKCNQSFVSQEILDEHCTNSHPVNHKICSICSAEFKSHYEYLIHKNKVHTQRFYCNKCKQKFYTQSALKFHERLCTRESKDFCFSCRHCGKRQKNLAVMRKHLGICMGKMAEQPIEPALKVSQNMQYEAVQKYEASNRHFLAMKNFNQPNDMHLNVSHATEKLEIESDVTDPRLMSIVDNEPGEKQSFKFIVDDSKFIFLNERKSAPSNELNDTVNTGLNGKFACDTCGLPFASFVYLKRHKMEHDSERKFCCSLCPKTFKGISGLKQHISGYHYKIKPYICSVCNYAYALKGDMQRCRHSKLKNQSSFKIA